MEKKVELHPDAQARREMLKQMHLRAGQKLQAPSGQPKSPQHSDARRTLEPPKS